MKNLKSYIILLAGLITGFNSAIAQEKGLDEYLVFAAKNNPEIKSAYTNFEAALQKAPQVSALPDPTLTISAFGQMMETRLGAQEARFNLMQMFPWFGKLKAQKTTAELMAEARFQKYLLTREKLFLEIRNAYAEMYAISEEIRLKEKNLSILDSYRKLALNRFEAGNSPMVNVVKVDIEREEAHTAIELMKEELATLKRQFNYLLNREPGASVSTPGNLEIPEVEALLLKVEDLRFEDHPEAEMLERERLAFENERLVAKKAGMPMLGLGVDYTVISNRTDANPVDNGQDAFMPMFSISLPVFRKKYDARIEEARLNASAVKDDRAGVLNDLKSEYEMTIYNFKKANRLIELYDKQMASSGQANKLLISGFSNAESDFEEVLQMNQDILMFQTQQLVARTQAYKAAAKLQFLLFKNISDENK